MFKWKNKSFPIFLMSQYQFQYQLPGQLVSSRIWIRPVMTKGACSDWALSDSVSISKAKREYNTHS